MVDKKLYLILICTMGVGQSMASLFDDLPDDFFGGPDTTPTTVLIPAIDIAQADGKTILALGGATDDSKVVREFNSKVKASAALYEKQITQYVRSFESKIDQLKGNSPAFIAKTKKEYAVPKATAPMLEKNIAENSDKLYQATKAWSAAEGLGLLSADEVKRTEAIKDCQKYVDLMAADLQELKGIAKRLKDELDLFDAAAAADAAEVAVTKAKEVAKVEEQKAEVASKKAVNSNNAIVIKAAENAEADAKTAKALARKRMQQALLAEAKLRKEKAKQVTTNTNNTISKAEALDENTGNIIAKIASLRDLVEQKVIALNALISKIQSNSSNYSSAFVSDVTDKIIPIIAVITKEFNDIISTANDVSEKLVDIEAKMKEEQSGLQAIIGRGGDDETEKVISATLENLNSELTSNLKIASRILQQAEEYKERLFGLYAQLHAAERGALSISAQSIERALELVRAVKIEQDQQQMMSQQIRRTHLEQKQEMFARVLDLCRAVKINEDKASMMDEEMSARVLDLSRAVKLA